MTRNRGTGKKNMLPDVSSESRRKTRLLRYPLTSTRILRTIITDRGRVRANSHIPCRSHATHAVPLPCHAMPLRV
jgi:hypothetical protein